MGAARTVIGGLLAVVATALALWATGVSVAFPDDALGTTAPAALVVQTAAVLGLACAGTWAAGSGRATASGWCLLAGALAVPFAVAPVQDVGHPLLFSIGLVAAGTPGVLVAAAAAYWPTSTPTRVGRAVTVLALLVAGVGVALPGLSFDPLVEGCSTCPRNLALVPALADVYPAARTLRDVAVLVAAAALAAVTAVHWWLSPTLFRRLAAPVVLPAIAVAVGTVGGSAHHLALPFGGFDEVSTRWWLAGCVMFLCIAAGVAVVAASIGGAASGVAALVVSAAAEPETLREGLARAMGDPGLTLTFPRQDGTLVDHDGRPVAHDDRPVLTVIRSGSTLAEIRHSARAAGAGRLLRPAVEAAGLGLEHAAARARVRAEARDVTVSTARLVAAGDAERRRIERNLHDGAQQQLITLALMVRSAEASADGDDREALAVARQDLMTALDELRALARGIFPVALHDAGLLAALDELADHAGAVLDITGDLAVEPPVPAAMAVYRLVADLVDTSVDGPVRVVIADEGQHLRVDVRAPGVTALSVAEPLRHAGDRVVAVGGELDLRDEAEPVGLRLVAVVPYV